MTLDKAQIQQIYDQVSSHNIHYEDLKNELTDHIATVVEQCMTNTGGDMESIIKEVLEDINPEKVQRKRMLTSILLPIRAFKMLQPVLSVLTFVITYLTIKAFYLLFDMVEVVQEWLTVALVISAVLPALLALADRKHKPYKMSFFMSAVLGCYITIYGLYNVWTFGFEQSFYGSTTASVIFHTIGYGMMALCYLAIYKQYQQAKKYASH